MNPLKRVDLLMSARLASRRPKDSTQAETCGIMRAPEVLNQQEKGN